MLRVKRCINRNFKPYATRIHFINENLVTWHGPPLHQVLWLPRKKALRLAKDILDALGVDRA